jgi:hypothetical protein
MTVLENLIGSPRFSPKKVSLPGRTWTLSEPSAPMCTCTTTTSLCPAASSITARAASRSLRLFAPAYEEKPTAATLIPLTSTTVICPSAPVCSSPAFSSALTVFL